MLTAERLRQVLAYNPETGDFTWLVLPPQITKDGRWRHLGLYVTPEGAYAAVCEAAAELHGEFARWA